ncbi:hypothetical protein ABFX02_06G130800 [Erythranthe guttata]
MQINILTNEYHTITYYLCICRFQNHKTKTLCIFKNKKKQKKIVMNNTQLHTTLCRFQNHKTNTTTNTFILFCRFHADFKTTHSYNTNTTKRILPNPHTHTAYSYQKPT